MPTTSPPIPSPTSNPSAIPPRRSLRLTDETWALLGEVCGLARLASEPSSVNSVIGRLLRAEDDRLRAKLKARGIAPIPPLKESPIRWPVGVPVPRRTIDTMRLGAPCPNVTP